MEYAAITEGSAIRTLRSSTLPARARGTMAPEHQTRALSSDTRAVFPCLRRHRIRIGTVRILERSTEDGGRPNPGLASDHRLNYSRTIVCEI